MSHNVQHLIIHATIPLTLHNYNTVRQNN